VTIPSIIRLPGVLEVGTLLRQELAEKQRAKHPATKREELMTTAERPIEECVVGFWKKRSEAGGIGKLLLSKTRSMTACRKKEG
jgi:hypothetical protein